MNCDRQLATDKRNLNKGGCQMLNLHKIARVILTLVMVVALGGFLPFNTTNVLASPGYGTITGHIYEEATSNPLYPATIRLENYDTGELIGEFSNYPDGSFHVVVEEGTYRLGASASGYVTAWYPNNCTREEATPITVELDGLVSDISFSLAQGGSIAGTVYNQWWGTEQNQVVFAVSGSQVVPPLKFEAANLVINPVEAKTGEAITISADITNLSNTAGTYTVTLWIDGTVEAGRNVSSEAGETTPVSFTVTRDAEGSYQVRFDRLFGSFNVIEAPPTPPKLPINWWLIIGAIAGVIVITALIYIPLRNGSQRG